MKTANRTYGVEIEVLERLENGRQTSTDEIAAALRAAGLNSFSEYYNHNLRDYWKVTTDSTAGYEVVSPILDGEAGLEQIVKVCEVLNTLGCKVDKSCGLHVHVDAHGLSNEQIGTIFLSYARWEAIFDSLVAPSRRDDENSYCGSLDKALGYVNRFRVDPRNAAEDIWGDHQMRYKKVNLKALLRHGTIEFRQHQGTTNAEKIVNWVVLLLGFVEKASTCRLNKEVRGVGISLRRFKKWLGLTESNSNVRVATCAEYINTTFAKFNPNLQISSFL